LERKENKLAREIVEVPISGKITTVEVKAGDQVKEGDALCYIESMKMENAIMAPVSGKITEVKVLPNQVVDTGDLIAVIEY
jgi:biotin carboxyl carrier protein